MKNYYQNSQSSLQSEQKIQVRPCMGSLCDGWHKKSRIKLAHQSLINNHSNNIGDIMQVAFATKTLNTNTYGS